MSLSARWRSMRRTRPGTLSISDCSALEISARIDVSCLPHDEIVAQIEFGAQAAHAVMQRLEMLGDVVEMAALDIGPQTPPRDRTDRAAQW